jgi:hypothetical protein
MLLSHESLLILHVKHIVTGLLKAGIAEPEKCVAMQWLGKNASAKTNTRTQQYRNCCSWCFLCSPC